MADHTHIEWTEATWNPVTGCTFTSPGCTNCYAMKLAGTRLRHHESRAGLTIDTKAGPVWTGEVRFNEQWLTQPLQWRRPRMIFVCAHGDLFHESVPDEWIDRVFAVMALAPQHTFQVLTKRSARMRAYVADRLMFGAGVVKAAGEIGGISPAEACQIVLGIDQHTPTSKSRPLPNVWLGVSVEDQARADERIPDLLATPAAVRWLSCEPLLGPVDLEAIQAERYVPEDHELDWKFSALQTGDYYWFQNHDYTEGGDGPYRDHRIDWIVAGGESGPGARPMHPNWARSLRDQCATAGVPFFFKQWGEHLLATERHQHGYPPGDFVDHLGVGGGFIKVGKKAAGRLLDGALHDGMPA